MFWVTFSHACMAFTPVPTFVVILVEDAFLVGGRAKGLKAQKERNNVCSEVGLTGP